MQRIKPKNIQDPALLSRILEVYLTELEQSPHALTLRNLAWDTQIPENVLRRLLDYYRTPADTYIIYASDFHIAFANIMVHYPTVTLWWDLDGEVYVAM
jgi:hypothetical protein